MSFWVSELAKSAVEDNKLSEKSRRIDTNHCCAINCAVDMYQSAHVSDRDLVAL